MKTFGIYLAFPPFVNLRHEGIGRHLVTLLRAIERRDDARFVIACPSWSRASLHGLFPNGNKPRRSFIGPAVEPYLWRFSWFRRAISAAPGKAPFFRRWTAKFLTTPFIWLLSRSVCARTPIAAMASAAGLLFLVALASPLITAPYLLDAVRHGGKRKYTVRRAIRFLKALASQITYDYEIRGMLGSIAEAADVSAWYSPTCFWPSVTEIKAPLLVCVPDVMLFEFPIGFAKADGKRHDLVFRDVLAVIKASENFVTFSDHVKQHTLIGKLGVPPQHVRVVRHAPVDLSPSITVNAPDNALAVSAAYCEALLLRAINRSNGQRFGGKFANSRLKFIFYASQFRPSKNLVSLIRAYDHLLRNRFIGHKLILTGHIASQAELRDEVRRRRLDLDVLFLPRLTESELAACYKLADLAISPSLFEGAMPFTFSEAVCLGTPVVMSDIPATREILDAEMCDLTLFDPYDWRAMADKIEWALANREMLKSRQATFLQQTLSRRTWDDVAGEYISILDEISRSGSPPRSV